MNINYNILALLKNGCSNRRAVFGLAKMVGNSKGYTPKCAGAFFFFFVFSIFLKGYWHTFVIKRTFLFAKF